MVIDGGGKILFKTRALESGTKGFKFPALDAEFRKAKPLVDWELKARLTVLDLLSVCAIRRHSSH
eukprot:271897-Amorphochlora_amoeboformis.AAC.1